MKCKIGDKVRFLNDVGGGIVSRIANANLIYVRDEEGFEVPVSPLEVVVVNSTSDETNFPLPTPRITQAPNNLNKAIEEVREDNQLKISEKREEEEEPEGEEHTVLLAFLPQNTDKPEEADLDLYLINDSPYKLFYHIGLWTDKGLLRTLSKGEQEFDSKEYICQFPRKDLMKPQVLNITFFLFKNKDFKPVPPEQIHIELNPIKFLKRGNYNENDYFDKPAYIVKLVDSEQAVNQKDSPEIDAKELKKAMQEKGDSRPAKPTKKPEAPTEEIDLHIENLVDNYKGMSNGEILEIQLARFTTALETGLRGKSKRMVFIHGVGNGKLKYELQKLLDTDYKSKVKYQDASFKEYGYGATLVLFK